MRQRISLLVLADYCSLASARSIGIAQELQERLSDKLDTGRGRIHINVQVASARAGIIMLAPLVYWASISLEKSFIRSHWVVIRLMTRRLARFLGALPAGEIVALLKRCRYVSWAPYWDETFNELLKRVGLSPLRRQFMVIDKLGAHQ